MTAEDGEQTAQQSLQEHQAPGAAAAHPPGRCGHEGDGGDLWGVAASNHGGRLGLGVSRHSQKLQSPQGGSGCSLLAPWVLGLVSPLSHLLCSPGCVSSRGAAKPPEVPSSTQGRVSAPS